MSQVQMIGDDIKVVRLSEFAGMPVELTALRFVVFQSKYDDGKLIVLDAGEMDVMVRDDKVRLANFHRDPNTSDPTIRGLLMAADRIPAVA